MVCNAAREAHKSEADHHKIGCVISDRKGNIISKGYNSSTKTHPIQYKYANGVNKPTKIFLHAEIKALIKLRERRKAINLCVVRIMKSKDVGMSKPCSICMEAIKDYKIKNLIYIDLDDSITIERV